MATKTDTFSKDSRYKLELYTKVDSQSLSGKYSIIYYRIRLIKSGTTGHAAWGTTSKGWADSSTDSSLWDKSFSDYDYADGYMDRTYTLKSGTFRVNHKSDGTASYWVNTALDYYQMGYARCDSGTIGLPRLANVPPAPDNLGLDYITHNSMRFRFHNNGDGGAAVDQWQIGYGTSSSGPQKYINYASGTSTVTGLSRYTTYYFWARGHNAVGWGPWSSRASARTLAEYPDAPTAKSVSSITQTSFIYSFSGNDNGGESIDEWQIGYGTSSSSPQYYQTADGYDLIDGLSPGTTYYVWSRGRNVRGWGPWSSRMTARTIAGARVRSGGVWKEAIPYVRVNGVWRLAQPHIRVAGVWRKTS